MGMSILPVEASNPEVKSWNSLDSMGCMMVRDCTEGSSRSTLLQTLKSISPANYDSVREEADAIISELGQDGVNVYLLISTSLVVTLVSTTLWVMISSSTLRSDDPTSMIRTLRHEPWHAPGWPIQEPLRTITSPSFVQRKTYLKRTDRNRGSIWSK